MRTINVDWIAASVLLASGCVQRFAVDPTTQAERRFHSGG